MNSYFPAPGVGPASPADNDYKPGFAAELMVKDLGLSQQAAEAVNADTPMGAHALALYQQFVSGRWRGARFLRYAASIFGQKTFYLIPDQNPFNR